MGRRKLVVQKLEDPKARQITYCKRKYGIMKKATEISKLCDVDIAVLMFSPRGKPTNFAGERSNLANVLGRLSRMTIEDRERRKSETVDILARIYKTDEHEVDAKNFKDEEHEKVEEAMHKVKEIKETVQEKKNRLRDWENIEGIDDIEKLKEMEGKLINYIRNLNPHLEHLKGQNEQGPQNAHQVCHVPLMQLVGSLQNPRLGSPQRANTEQLVGRTIDEELIDTGRFGFRLDGSLLWFDQRGNTEESTNIGHDINIGEIGVTNGFGFESSGHFQVLNLSANIGLQDVNVEGSNGLLSGCSQDLNPMYPQMYNIFGSNVEGQVDGGNDLVGGCYQELNPGYPQIVNIEGQVPMNIEGNVDGGNELLSRRYREINLYRANIEGQAPMNIEGQVGGNIVLSGYYQELNYGNPQIVNIEGQAPVNVEAQVEGCNNLLSGYYQELNHGYPQIANIEGRAPANIGGQIEGGNYLLNGHYQEFNYLGYPQIANMEGQFMTYGEESEQNNGLLSGSSQDLISRENVEKEALNIVINEEKVGGDNNLSWCFKEINPGANIERPIVNVEGEAEEDDLLNEWLHDFNFGENIEKQALNIEEGEGSNDLGFQDLIPRANIEGQDVKVEEVEGGSNLGFNANKFFHDPNSWVPQSLDSETNMLNTGRETGLGYNASFPNSNLWLPQRATNEGQDMIIGEEVWEANGLESQFPFKQQVAVNHIQQLPLNNSTMNEGPNISDEANDLEDQYMSQWEHMMDEIEWQLKEDDGF